MKELLLRAILPSLVVIVSLLSPVPALAANCGAGNSPKGQVYQGINVSGAQCNGDKAVNKLAHTVVSILSMVVGIASIIMVVVGGLKYITSGGDSGKVENAKGTIIYALIGVAIAALAQVLVHFVLYNTNKAAGG